MSILSNEHDEKPKECVIEQSGNLNANEVEEA
jgi:hypothetical protein